MPLLGNETRSASSDHPALFWHLDCEHTYTYAMPVVLVDNVKNPYLDP